MDTLKHSSHWVVTEDRVKIALHLNAGNERESVIVICPGFFQSHDTSTFKALANDLADAWDVIGMDFRGHGQSEGLFSFSAREIADLSAVLSWAQPHYRRVGILGFSLGAATAINTLSVTDHHAHALACISAPSSFGEIEFKFWTLEAMRTGLRGMERGAGCRPGNPFEEKECPQEHISRIAPTPVLLVHGTSDPIISHPHSERLFSVAHEPKRLALIEGGGHAEELYRGDPAGFVHCVREWFEECRL